MTRTDDELASGYTTTCRNVKSINGFTNMTIKRSLKSHLVFDINED